MNKDFYKTGLFVLLGLFLLLFSVLRLSKGSFFTATYPLILEVDSAMGLAHNTPVMVSGVTVGLVDDIQLTPSHKAKVTVNIKKEFEFPRSLTGLVRTTGVLGDAYIDLIVTEDSSEKLKPGDTVAQIRNEGDFNMMMGKVALLADDLVAISAQWRKLMAGDDAVFSRSLRNIDKLTESLAKMAVNNQNNVDLMLKNMRELSQNLNQWVALNSPSATRSLNNLDQITGGLARGEGTVGRLLHDEATVDKLNDTLDGINGFLGSANRLRVDMGLHSEYLGGTGDFKNYVSLFLKPRPYKYFLFELVSDPDPSFRTTIENTTVTSGSTTSEISTQNSVKTLDGFQFSAQIAKSFKDFTIRGGLIESSGGVGLDYDRGPFGVEFSAFDFKSFGDQKPHLKFLGTTHVTKSFYFLGGVDDFINQDQDLAWFVGAGLRFTDDDIKSLISFMPLSGIK